MTLKYSNNGERISKVTLFWMNEGKGMKTKEDDFFID